MGMLFGLFLTMKCILLPPAMTVTYYNYSTCRSTPCVTASGEKFDPVLLTGAHYTLPFGTKVKVTLEHKSVIIVVNDRINPKYKDRLDITEGAAKVIGLDKYGRYRCLVEVVK